MVLSNEACEQGKDCKDKDCIKSHISPAAVNPALGMFLYLVCYPFLTLCSRAPTKYAGSFDDASTDRP